eukprot:10875227-Heterocapsa_arctica.AAC.1
MPTQVSSIMLYPSSHSTMHGQKLRPPSWPPASMRSSTSSSEQPRSLWREPRQALCAGEAKL